MIGKTISHYKILEKLGEGGMGEVYLAEDLELRRKVALKFLPSQYTSDPDLKARFKREAQVTAALNHPFIVTVYEIGEYEGNSYIAMEYVEGESLGNLLSKEALSVNQAIEIISQTCEGLSKAHQAGIVHRDIKPANILMNKEGVVKIVDFGLAKLKGGTKLTREGTTMGTPHYMSPEQIKGDDLDQRSDIFSLGIVFYELITRQLPFKGESELAVMYSISSEDPEPLSKHKPNLSPGLQRIIDKALGKNLESRYQKAEEFLEDLRKEKAIASQPFQPTVTIITAKPEKKEFENRRVKLLVSSAVFVLLVTTVTIFLIQDNRKSVSTDLPETKHKELSKSPGAAKKETLLNEKPDESPTMNKLPETKKSEPLMKMGELRITSNPSEASVWVNGKLVGGTPFEDNTFKARNHNLVIRLNGYQDFTRALTVRKGQLTSIVANLIELLGGIEVTSDPAGAAIFMDGQKVGTTPDKIQQVKVGEYEIVLQKEGFRDYAASVNVEFGKVSTVDRKLAPLISRLQVLVRPFGNIYIDDELRKKATDVQYTTNLSAGRHRIKAVHPIFGIWEKTIGFQPDSVEIVYIDFNKHVEFAVTAFDNSGNAVISEIFVDKKSTRKYTPKELTLRVGKHTIEVRRDGYVLEGGAKEINLEGDVIQPLVFRLTKIQ